MQKDLLSQTLRGIVFHLIIFFTCIGSFWYLNDLKISNIFILGIFVFTVIIQYSVIETNDINIAHENGYSFIRGVLYIYVSFAFFRYFIDMNSTYSFYKELCIFITIYISNNILMYLSHYFEKYSLDNKIVNRGVIMFYLILICGFYFVPITFYNINIIILVYFILISLIYYCTTINTFGFFIILTGHLINKFVLMYFGLYELCFALLVMTNILLLSKKNE